MHLETLPRGTEVDLLLDDPQGARDVPRAAEAAGHLVIAITPGRGAWTITIEV